MRCARCDKRIRKAYYVNGRAYGIECARMRGYSDKKVIIKNATEIDLQIDLFDSKEMLNQVTSDQPRS